jgi:ATP-binding protein involved in chromosome partitioning
MTLSKDQILDTLQTVQDPELARDIVTLNLVKHVAVCDGVVNIEIQTRDATAEQREQLRASIREAVEGLGETVEAVSVEFTTSLAGGGGQAGGEQPGAGQAQSGDAAQGQGEAQSDQQQNPQDGARASNPLPNVKHMIAVGAGKGGVGKSTVAVNLAVGLARSGYQVGLLDGDIYGPSLPTMLGLTGQQPQAKGKTIIPFQAHGLKTISVGSLVEQEKPLIWRGPMAHGAFRQIATQTEWGQLDYLIIDLPPGTGDVPLTMAQLLPLTGAIVVCTPQKVAQDDARRAARMFQQLGIDVLGLVENMSYFICDHGSEHDIFGRGGAAQMAEQIGVPLLGTIPIHMDLVRHSDAGDPTANFTADDMLARELQTFTENLTGQVHVHTMSENAQGPTLSIH